MHLYKDLYAELNRGEQAALITTINTSTQTCVQKAVYLNGQKDLTALPPGIDEALQKALQGGKVEIREKDNMITVIEPFFPEPRLLILGGGHIAKPLCAFAAKVGFAVTVVDDRPTFANHRRFPEAEQVICAPFAEAIEAFHFTPYTYVVVVTRGHRHDQECLRAVLPKRWAYVGMIGSKRRVTGIMEQLQAEGFAPELLAKVNTPIGLAIGAVTPEEIAVSILAELISFRRLEEPKLGKDSKVLTRTEFDREVLAELARGDDEKKAIATIVATKGSVPRKAGAKMLIWPDGRILGSIGGGCSESDVIREARILLDHGGCKLLTVDLTGEIAADMGMVCGGMMQVLVETWPFTESTNY
ncbi:MAG: xanthine dehydrogenase [Firmicutes bacterium]|nr:xanthine dehydrogenase [Bacillota bacterium]